MDTSETYIKMCEKAEEIQLGWRVACGDYCWVKSPDKRVVIVSEGNLDIRTSPRNGVTVIFPESYGDNSDYKLLPHLIWLPRQDQLQGMVEVIPSPKLFAQFVSFLGWDGATFCKAGYPMSRPPLFTSMEQLWLAFVQKELRNLTWNGEGWE